MPHHLHVIVNPASAGGKGERMVPRLEEELGRRGLTWELKRTVEPGHARSLASRAVDTGARRILAVGGDGTIHEIANGVLDRADSGRVALAVVPVGTGNDFYRMVGAPTGLTDAVEVMHRGVERAFDVGLARWEGGQAHFVNLVGLGVDVEVLRQRARFRRLSGLIQYLAALLAAVVRFEPFPVRVCSDGETFEDRTHLCAVTVGPSAAGGFLLSPGATPDDGELDLCFVQALTFPQILRYIPRVIRGTHGELDVVRLRRLRSIRVEATGHHPFHIQLDGELVPTSTPWLEAEVRPGVLTVMVPRDGARA